MTRLHVTIVVAIAAALAACVPPSQSGTTGAGTGAAAYGEPAHGEPTDPSVAGGGTCEGACARLGECGLAAEQCLDVCRRDGHDPTWLAGVESASCEVLAEEVQNGPTSEPAPTRGGYQGGLYSGEGSSCVGGSGGCSGVTICCGSAGPVAHGMPGTCRSAPICNMPRR